MFQNVNGLSSLLSTVLQKTTNQTVQQVTVDNTSILQNQDSYVKTSTSLIPELYSNQVKEPINQEEYSKYCGTATLPDGTNLYFPPANASYAEKKAWIDGLKKLDAEGKGGEIAVIKMGVIHQIREQNNLSVDDLSALKLSFDASSGSAKDILMALLDEQKDQLNKGDSFGVDPEKFIKLQQEHIDALQSVLNSF